MNMSLSKFCKDHDLPKSSVYRRCQELSWDVSDGLTAEQCDRLRHEFDAAFATELRSVPVVEVGNHSLVLASPELPQTFSLEALRTTEAHHFEDPLALARQFIQAADQIVDAMDDDIDQRKKRLQQTQKAKEQIQDKTHELKLKQRLYREQTLLTDSVLNQETDALHDALQTLQTLGKDA